MSLSPVSSWDAGLVTRGTCVAAGLIHNGETTVGAATEVSCARLGRLLLLLSSALDTMAASASSSSCLACSSSSLAVAIAEA